ncbi:MAG: PAS domain S-box protein [Ignavibacteria bacterium]|nr:PAS domain S-box protein [Ignavibacteria bacterium]
MALFNGTPRIMIVEDEGIIAQDIKSCLESLGYIVSNIAFTGKEAIDKLESDLPDLILMDIVLKGDIDGSETAREIKNRYNVPIVYLTAYEDDKTLNRAKQTEPLGYILKPFEERYLRSSIEMALYKHQMETLLKENERWLSTILKSVGDAVIVSDEKGFIRFMNPVAESLTGYKIEEASGKKVEEIIVLIDESSGETVENPVNIVLKDDIVIGRTNHTILISKSGNKIPIDHSASPIRDEKGLLKGAVLIIQDITERKNSERVLKENENKYRNLFDFATDAIFVQSLDGRIISVNNKACELFGYSREEFRNMKFSDLIGENITDSTFLIYQSLKEKGNYQFESRYKCKDGSFVDVDISMKLIRLHDEEVVQLFVRDISDKKAAQEKLNILAAAVKSISEAVSITDNEGKLIFVNQAFERMYGYKSSEILGKEINFLRSSKNSPELLQLIDTKTKQGGWQGELINVTKDGREFPIYLSTSLLKNDKGETIASIGIANDITERKAYENALRLSEQRYQDLYDSAPDMYFSILPDGTVKSVNKSGAEYLGYNVDELIGNEVWKVVYKDDLEYVTKKMMKIFTTKLTGENLEFRKVKKDGTVIWVNESTKLLFDKNGEPKELFIICRDITKNKEFQLALQESERKYRNLAHHVPVSVARYSLITNEFEYANKEFERQMGCSVEEYSKLSRQEKSAIIYNEDREKVYHNYEKWKRENCRGMLHFDYRIVNRKGEFMWLDTFIYADFDETGKPAIMNEICIDITERKNAELSILASERRYRNLASNAPVAVTRINAKTMKYEYVNDEFTRQTGFTMDEYNNLSKEELKALSYPEDFKRVNEFFNKWKENGFKGTHKLEYRLFNRSGEIIWLDTYLYADFDEKGNLLAINQICIDITEQKKANEKIKENEEKYRNLASNAPVAVTRFLIKENIYDFANEEFTRQSGYTIEEYNRIDDNKLIEMVHPEDRERIFRFYKDWSKGGYKGTQHIDYRIFNRFKKLVWLDTYLYAEFDKEGKAFAINQICIDITEQKKAQEELREKDKKFKVLIDNVNDIITLLNKDGDIKFSSPSLEKLLGYKENEFLNNNILNYIHPDDRDAFIEKFNLISSKTDKNILNVQFRCLTSSGEWKWHEGNLQNLLDEPLIEAIILTQRDITERKKAEEEILLQKSYFQQLFENSPEGIVMLDNEDRVVNVNKGFEKMFQYSLEEIKGKTLNNFIVPESLQEQASQFSLFVVKGEIIQRETVRKRKDGSNVEVSILAYPITLGENQIGIYGIYSDITERKETEKALRNSEERYKAFIKQSTEGIWRFEFLEPISIDLPHEEQLKLIFRYGYLAECNDVFAKMYGYDSATELIGTRLSDLLPESDPRNIEFIKSGIASGYKIDNQESYETDRFGNTRVFINNLVGILENNYLVRVWGTQRDITEAKRAQEELQRTQLKLATLLENLPDVVLYEIGPTYFISENVKDLLGYPQSMFIENKDFLKSLMHPSDRMVVEEKNKEWEENGSKGVLNTEFRARRENGEYLWIEDHKIKLKMNDGSEKIAGVLIDVNEHKRAEAKLKTLAEKLSQSNKELEQFAYVASHDLQEPLRMVSSYIQLLQKRYKGSLDAQADEFINYAVEGVSRMKMLINDLLIYSRVNTREFEFEPVDCNLVLKQTISNLKTAIDESGAIIRVEPLPTVYANSLYMGQLFQNLLSNAIKFRKEGVRPEITVSAKHNQNEWMFSVSDNGIGLEKEFAEKIFVIFQRLHSNSEYPGTGIGLAICKRIAEKFGGHIWVESEKGKGATFHFTVPDRED